MSSGSSPEPVVRRGIGRKLALWVAGTALALGTVLAFVLVPVERGAVERTAADQVGLLAEAVATTYAVVDEAKRTHRAQEVILQVGRGAHVAWVDVLDHTGKVTRSSRVQNLGLKRDIPTPGDDGVRIRDELLVVSHRLPWRQSCVGCHAANHDPVGVVTVAVDRKAALQRLERFHLFGGLAILAVFAVLAGVILVITERLVSRPVASLAKLMAKAEQGDFLVRARHASDDELGALSRAFNSMLKNITSLKASEIEREADLQQARQELELKQQLEEANADLERRVAAQQLLMEAANRLASTLDRDALLDRLEQLILERVHLSDFALFLVEADEDGEAVLRVARAEGRPDQEEVREARIKVGEGITGFVAETGAPLLIPDVAKEEKLKGLETKVLTDRDVTNPGPGAPARSGTLASVPMLHKGRVVGVLDFFHERTEAFDDDDLALFQALGSQAAMAVVNADLYEQTLELSVTDPLTGLMNRRAMERRLQMELVRAQRFSHPLCVLMIDVDHFKNYNDRMGHLLGDEALKAVARALEGSVRKVDAVARFGGEEFCVFLPRTDLEAGLDVAEKLHAAVRAVDTEGVDTQPLGHLSVSVGLAVYPQDMPPVVDGPPAQVLLDRADQAVYAAKKRGRDRTVSAADVLGKEPRPELNQPGGIPKENEGAAGKEPSL